MSDEFRVTLAIVCACLGAVIGTGCGYALAGCDILLHRPDAASGIRLILAGGFALFILRKTLRDTQ